jgi:hypothetical protein
MRHLSLSAAFLVLAANPFLTANEIPDKDSPSVITARTPRIAVLRAVLGYPTHERGVL